MSLPAPYIVTHATLTPGATDSHGNATETWGFPASVAVHGWAPPAADKEPGDDNRNAVIRDLDLYAPAGTTGGPRDRWTVDGVTYEQVGHPEDFTRGPWQWAAGVRINLRRVEG